MIYLENTTETQEALFPKSYAADNGAYTLYLEDTMGSKVVSLEVTDKETNDLYYTFDITLPEGLTGGEYRYRLLDADGELMSLGVLVLEATFEGTWQNDAEIEYEQYEREF